MTETTSRREGEPVPIRLAVLDMAGTTVRDGGIVQSSFLLALESIGIEHDDPANAGRLEYVQATMGQSKIEVFRGLLHNEDLAQRATRGFEAAIAETVRAGAVEALPGAEDTFATLRAAGVRICLTTGFAPETQQLIMAALGWDDRVDLTLAPGPGRRGRPYPDLALHALMALGIDDVRSLAVAGDTANDLRAGWHAGAGVVAGVLTGAHDRAELEAAPHTHILPTIADLPAAIAESA
ncbi:MAG TPA: phosphonatase-like hydrolase [Acidimicrobiales bacterium]